MVASDNLAINRSIMPATLCFSVLLLTQMGSTNASLFLLLVLALFYLFSPAVPVDLTPQQPGTSSPSALSGAKSTAAT